MDCSAVFLSSATPCWSTHCMVSHFSCTWYLNASFACAKRSFLALPSASIMFTPATARKAQSISMKTQAVPLPCFLWFSPGGGVSDIVSRVRASTRTWKVFKVDGHEYFSDFGHDREVQVNKLVTFSILKKYLDSEKLG